MVDDASVTDMLNNMQDLQQEEADPSAEGAAAPEGESQDGMPAPENEEEADPAKALEEAVKKAE